MARVPHTILGLSNQTLVQVEIVNGDICCYPQRGDDTVIYYCTDPMNYPPQGRPREVRWVITGIPPDHSVRIEPKDHTAAAIFAGPPSLEVKSNHNSVTSGFPLLSPGKGKSLRWSYSIALCDPKGNALRTLDPDVIIKDWP